MTANRAIRPLLDQLGHTITPTNKRLYSAAEVTSYAAGTFLVFDQVSPLRRAQRPERVEDQGTNGLVGAAPHIFC